MKQLKDACHLCDITLCVGDHQFKVHRLVLAASSPYFSAMFTNQHMESTSAHVQLSGVDPGAVASLVGFAYSSNLTISEENVQTVLAAANLLQMTPVVEACCEFLVAQLDVENCLGIAAFAEMLSCSQLYQTSWRFALENFHEVWRMEEFLSTPAPLLQELMRSEHLQVHSEEEVLECVLLWYSQDKQTRLPAMKKLLCDVKLPLIPWSTISSTLLTDPSLSSDEGCQLLFVNAKHFQTSPEMALDSADSTHYLPRKSVGQNQFLYVIGGETTPGRSTVGSMERLNPNKNTWTSLAPMATARRGVGVAFLNGLLYVVGGSDGIQALR